MHISVSVYTYIYIYVFYINRNTHQRIVVLTTMVSLDKWQLVSKAATLSTFVGFILEHMKPEKRLKKLLAILQLLESNAQSEQEIKVFMCTFIKEYEHYGNCRYIFKYV